MGGVAKGQQATKSNQEEAHFELGFSVVASYTKYDI